MLPIVALTITFFLLNSISTATAISLASGQSVVKFWSQNYLSLGVEFSVSAVPAGIIVTLYSLNPWVPLAAAPLIGVVWGWNKLNKAKAMEAERHLKEQEPLYFRTVESLALAVDAKDQTTYGHIRRVRAYAMGLAKLCGIRDPSQLTVETGSLLHDIGKLAIDDYILNKPGRLTRQEFEKMKIHSEAGDEILKQVQFPFPVATYVRSHHERWDGLSLLGVDEMGLDEIDRKILRVIIEDFGGGPVGLKAISISVGEEARTIEEVYEPFLIQTGLIKRTSQGREATPAARGHLPPRWW